MTVWTVRAPGADIAVFEFGDRSAASTVLLVHGYPDDHHLYDPLIAELGDAVRVVTYDTRGSGASTDDLVDNSIERLAEDAYAVVDSIPGLTDRVHVFAHDWGLCKCGRPWRHRGRRPFSRPTPRSRVRAWTTFDRSRAADWSDRTGGRPSRRS